jgi:hypothetical protein
MAFDPCYITTHDGYKVDKRATFIDPYNCDWLLCHDHSNNTVVIMKKDRCVITVIQNADSITLKEVMLAIGYDIDVHGLCDLYISDEREVSDLILTKFTKLPICTFEVDIEFIPYWWYC